MAVHRRHPGHPQPDVREGNVKAKKVEPPVHLDELVYVQGLLTAEPVWHVVRDIHDDRRLLTVCDLTVSFGMKQTLMPSRHAEKFAKPCGACS